MKNYFAKQTYEYVNDRQCVENLWASYENLLKYEYNGARSMLPIEKVLMKSFYENVLLKHHRDDYLIKRMEVFIVDASLRTTQADCYNDIINRVLMAIKKIFYQII